MVPNILGNPARIRVQWSGAQAIRLAISLWEDNYTREKWEDVQWGQNELRMRARRVAKRLSRDSPLRWELSREGIPWNPAAVTNGFLAKQET